MPLPTITKSRVDRQVALRHSGACRRAMVSDRDRERARFRPSGTLPCWGRWVIAALILAGALHWPVPSAAESTGSREQLIKAAFIYNFLKFVEWPSGRFANSDAPILIGVAGKNSIVLALETAVRDRKINGHDLQIRVVETPEAALASHVLFIPAAEDRRVGDLLKAVAGSSILTVGESETFAKQDGMINFVPEGDKIRFEINMEPAERADLRISAQLQKLARSVRRKP